MRFRAAPLQAAAIVAAVFVVARVIYRIVFGGGTGGGVVLVDAPRIPLDGPFAHISLFGPVTSGGIANAALSALPFAAVILAFGLVNAIVDMQRVFVKGSTRGPLRSVARSLVIAWATAPALADATRRVRRAAALRGERGPAALLVPVFEHTIERALALAATMEVRGFAASVRLEPDRTHPVSLANVSLDQGAAWRLEAHDVVLAPGTLAVLVGPTGSGKSSLLDALSGLFQHFEGGRQGGTIEVGGVDRRGVPPRETSGYVGVVAQQVRLAFASATVREEIGFALATRGDSHAHVDECVRDIAEQLGITRLLGRSITALSAGEATLVAIAAALVSGPALLLVDEPLAELDDEARRTVCAALDRAAHANGVCVVVAEHRTSDLLDIADTWLEIRDGTVAVAGSEAAAPCADGPDPNGTRRFTAAAAENGDEPIERMPRDPLASVRGLSATLDGTDVVRDASLSLVAGEVVALLGPNGAGKSTLLGAMAVAERPGTVTIDGTDVASVGPRERRRAITLVPEAFDDLFFATTTAMECHRADRRDRPAAPTAETFARLLGRSAPADAAAFDELLLRHPRDLSAGERMCLAIAIQLAPAPAVLLIDEPARGLDASARALVGAALLEAASESRTVLFATHDAEFTDRFAARTLRIDAGTISPALTATAAVRA